MAGCRAFEETWIGILQKCRQTGEPSQAKRLHACLREQGLDAHPLLGNFLVPMLVDCGSLPDAQHAFDRLPPHHRNIHSWTSLIAGYVHSRHPHRAFQLYLTMQESPHCASPNIFTYLALLDALHDLDTGRDIHADIVTRGFDKALLLGKPVVGNSLVDLYSKFGSIAEARRVLDRLPHRDAVSWNALIAGYIENGLTNEAKSCVHLMQLEGLPPDSVTFVCSLKACSTPGSLGTGRELHAGIVKMGLESELFLGSTLVDMYTKSGLLSEGHHVFDRLPFRDAVSWNALMMGSIEHGHDDQVLAFFKQMQQEGTSGDDVTFICALKACSMSRALGIGQAVHSEIVIRGLERELHVANTLVDVYCRCGSLAEARQVFFRLPVQDAVSWNAIIAGYAEYELHEEVKSFYQKMQLEGILPDLITYGCSLKACCTIGALGPGQEIHAEATIRGLEKELHIGSTLVDMYTKCSLLADARQVSDRLPSPDVVSWNVLIGAYSEHGLNEEVINCFQQMRLQGVPADAVTFIVCLKACGSLGALETGREIHAEIRRSGLENDLLVGCMLIDMYGKCASVAEAQEVFDQVPDRDTVSWNALIKAYGDNHDGRMAVQCFEHMQGQCVKPDSVTFSSLLAACSHASLTMEGQKYFKVMTEKHGIAPTLEHHACITDLLARSGLLYEAERYIAAMQCPPSNVVLKAVLSACKVYGEVDLGQRCFQQLVEANQEGSTAFLLMADIYASAGRWRDANKVEEMRNHAGAKKKPGTAILEVNKEFLQFTVGANYSQDICQRIGFCISCLKDQGYVPHVDCQATGAPTLKETVIFK